MGDEQQFEWDPNKAESNKKKHKGVTFKEASTIFKAKDLVTVDDNRHNEPRKNSKGTSNKNRKLFVTHTNRRKNKKDSTRIISARPLNEKTDKKWFPKLPKLF